jgi:hypothetical protein
MSINDKKLNNFFKKQKFGSIDALKKQGKVCKEKIILHKNSVSEPLVIREQTVSKPLVIREQSVSEPLVIREQTVSETVSNPLAKPLVDFDNFPEKKASLKSNHREIIQEEYLEALFSLSNKEKQFLEMLIAKCKEYCTLSLPPISTEEIRGNLKISAEHVRNLVYRLSKKNILTVEKNKSGRNAIRKFKLDKILYRHIQELTLSEDSIRERSVSKTVSNPLERSSVVSSYINTNYRELDISDDWASIDLTSLESIGFNSSHLVQIYRTYDKDPNIALSPELLQSSIDAFAYDLKNNEVEKNFKKPAATVLLSLLKKGQPYNSITPDKCVSPVQDALNKHNQMLLVQRTKEQQLLQQIKDTEFSVWIEELPEEELLLLCPEKEVPLKDSEKLFKTVRKRMAREKAKDYFDAEIWPSKKQSILASAKRKLMQNEEPQQTNDEVEQ